MLNTITYEAVRIAKNSIEHLMETGLFQDLFDKKMPPTHVNDWELIKYAKAALEKVIDRLGVAERTVIMYGGFVYDISHGSINFNMPATKDVVGKELIDSDKRHDRVVFTLDVSQVNATDAGFYREDVTIFVDTGRF